MNRLLLNQSRYPSDYRKQDVKEIVERLVGFQPLTLVGLPRVGLARILRFILVRPELIENKLGSKKVCLIEIDMNDLFAVNELNFWQLVLKRIADITNQPTINKLYLSAAKTNDVFTFFDNTKQALAELCSQGNFVFLFFNRFDRGLSLFSFLFFAHLQSLKDLAKTKINFLFTSNRPLEDLSPDIFQGGNLEVFSQKYFLKPCSQKDLLPVIGEFEKTRKIKLKTKIKDLVYDYSGGHAQYALLILQALEKNKFDLKNLDQILKNDLSIFQQGKEIWDYLNHEILPNRFRSQVGLIKPDGKLFNPLFDHFVATQSAIEKESFKELTKKEKALLEILSSRKQELVTREEIINFVWPKNSEETSDWALDQLVKRLRKKLSFLKRKEKIITVKNQGYKLIF